MKFIDRLKLAIERQVLEEKAKDELVLKLNVWNANPKCKEVLRALPTDSERTLMQMIEACNCIGTLEHSAVIQAKAVGQGVANALAALQIIPQGPLQQQSPSPATQTVLQKSLYSNNLVHATVCVIF